MALTFKGTTTEVLAAILGGEIVASTKVTIEDNTYTAANLLTIIAATNNLPVILLQTAAGIPLSATPAELVTIIEGVNKYTGALTAITDPATAEQLNIIANGTTGKVTAVLETSTTIDAATVTALKNVSSTDSITFVPTQTIVTGKSDLEALVALSKKLPNANWAAVVDFEGTASELSAIKSALTVVDADVTVTSGQISAADANAIAKATDGDLTATLKSATVKATLSALKDIAATDILDFTTTETTVNASDLVALETKLVLGTQDYTSITTITETATAVAKDDALTVTTALGYTLAATVDVKISGNISATNAATIATAATTGILTATVFPGTAQNLEAALNGVTGALTLTLTDETVVAGTLADLNDITTVAINANSVKTITAAVADVANVTTVYAAAVAKEISGLGNEIITITGAGDITATIANDLVKLTSGKVVATVTADAAADLVAALTDANAKDELSLTVDATPSTAKDLLALDGKTSIAITLPAFAVISGTAAEIKKVYASSGITTANDEVITVTDTASAADVNAIAKASGAVTATIKDGSVAATLKAIGDVVAGDTITFKTTDKTANANDLVDLKVLVDTFNTASVTTITEKAADIGGAGATVIAALGIANNAAVTITNGTISATDAGLISVATTGKVTATVAADIAANIVTGLNGIVAGDENDALNITVNGATASVANLNTIDAQTALKVKVDAATVTAANYAEFETIYVTNKANFSNLGDENITVAANVTAAQADAIAKATSKVVTANVDSATADVLVSNLKNAKDALALTVTGEATAKDLLTLDGKTTVSLNVNGVTKITGTAADVKKVYDADGIATQGDEAVTLSGTVTAADANALALQTSGVVTATIAAGTAAALNTALVDGIQVNAYTLTVNGTTASAATLELLNAKTTVDIKVDAKEITGTFTEVEDVYVDNVSDYTGLGNKNVKITGTVTTLTDDIDAILDATTGIVTATLTSATATNLLAETTKATSKDALTLVVNGATESAADLLTLDGRTSVVVNASAVTEVTGSAADIKTVLAAKTITKAAAVDATVSGVISAADANTISKATTGVVEATVDAGTAAALKSALAGVANDGLDALTLTVTGATAAAVDLIALDAKTSVDVVVNATTVTGNIADVTKVLVTDAANFTGEDAKAVTISGTVSAAQADAIADKTSGVVTATVTAANASTLDTALSDAQVNAYKLTVSGTTADAANLVSLDGKTSVVVNAAEIKNIEGDAADVKAAYDANALKTISGLGNETVDLSAATDANVSLVNAINNYTTGVITLDTLNTTAGNFSLSQLGDLKGITGLNTLDVVAGDTNITLSLKDLLASNDSTNSFAFNIDNGATGDTVKFADTTGWTADTTNSATGLTLYTNDVTSQVITINHTDVVVVA